MSDLKGYEEVTKVLAWLPKSPATFDPTFVKSLKVRLSSGRDLTERQLMAIRTIIIKFDVDGSRIKRKPPVFVPGGQYYKISDATSHYY